MKKLVFAALMMIVLLMLNCDVLINPEPNMFVYQDSTEIPLNSDIINFGRIEVGKSHSLTFKIINKGRKVLLLKGSPLIHLLANNENSFSADGNPETVLKTGESTTFTLKFTPPVAKLFRASVIIYNSDHDKNGYFFRMRGTGIEPDIVVRQDDQVIPIDIGVYDFGNVYRMYSSDEVVFTIENIGSSQLELTGTQNLIEISGTNASMFKINPTMTTTPIAPGDTTTFTIIFSPTSLGVKTATISIANSDNDEDPYIFTIKGTGIAKDPTFDFNGDGISDLVIGGEDHYDKSVYLFLGKETFAPDIEATEADVTFQADYLKGSFGNVVSAIGDFNNDGFDDVAIADFRYKNSPREMINAVFVFFGKPNPKRRIYTSDADIIIKEDPLYLLGISGICEACDLNNDNFDDLVLSTYGRGISVFYGRMNSSKELTGQDADVVISTDDSSINFGSSTSSIGDFNGDGFGDIIIGAPAKISEDLLCGYAYVYFGSSNLPENMGPADANVDIKGDIAGDQFGSKVSPIGDYNNDGFDDVLVFSYYFQNGSWVREGYIFLGERNPPQKIDGSDTAAKIQAKDDYKFTGSIVCGCVGDVNNDNYDDFILSMYHPQSQYYATFGLFYGKQNPQSILYLTEADIVFEETKFSAQFERNYTSVGDLNYDGYTDLLVSAYKLVNGNYTGDVYLFYGHDFYEHSYVISDANVHFYRDTEVNWFGGSISGGR